MTAPPAALLNKNKKNFIGMPAPLGYVAGVGRGYVAVRVMVFTMPYFGSYREMSRKLPVYSCSDTQHTVRNYEVFHGLVHAATSISHPILPCRKLIIRSGRNFKDLPQFLAGILSPQSLKG